VKIKIIYPQTKFWKNPTRNVMKLTFIFFVFLFATTLTFGQDWANLNRFRNENAQLGLPLPNENRVVFMGNSITEGWSKFNPDFFVGKSYINRGISGQTTPQMLVRFRADVINLDPKIVVILAGTNDIAGNTGFSTLEMIMENIISMTELAKANNVKVILCSVLPAFDYPWKTGLNPAEKIAKLNEMIKQFAETNGIIYLDYYSSMVDERKGLKSEFSYDGVHPNETGYKIMAPLAEEAIKNALIK
jgi:lysophospholipase L1-like esterase